MSTDEAKEVYKRLDDMQVSINRILGIMESDDKFKEKGLVEKVNIMHNQLSDLLTREKVYRAKATTWGILGGAVGTALIWVGKALLTKIFAL